MREAGISLVEINSINEFGSALSTGTAIFRDAKGALCAVAFVRTPRNLCFWFPSGRLKEVWIFELFTCVLIDLVVSRDVHRFARCLWNYFLIMASSWFPSGLWLYDNGFSLFLIGIIMTPRESMSGLLKFSRSHAEGCWRQPSPLGLVPCGSHFELLPRWCCEHESFGGMRG